MFCATSVCRRTDNNMPNKGYTTNLGFLTINHMLGMWKFCIYKTFQALEMTFFGMFLSKK